MATRYHHRYRTRLGLALLTPRMYGAGRSPDASGTPGAVGLLVWELLQAFGVLQLNRPSIPRRGAHPAARPIGRSDLPSEAPAPQTRGFCLSGASGLSPFWFSSPPKPSGKEMGRRKNSAPKRGKPQRWECRGLSARAPVEARQPSSSRISPPNSWAL